MSEPDVGPDLAVLLPGSGRPLKMRAQSPRVVEAMLGLSGEVVLVSLWKCQAWITLVEDVDILKTPDDRWAFGRWNGQRYVVNPSNGFPLLEVVASDVVSFCNRNGCAFSHLPLTVGDPAKNDDKPAAVLQPILAMPSKRIIRPNAVRDQWFYDQYVGCPEKSLRAIRLDPTVKTKGWRLQSDAALRQAVRSHCDSIGIDMPLRKEL